MTIDATIDAFARARMVTPLTIFDSKLTTDARPDFWDDAETSGADTDSQHSSAAASVLMSLTADTAGTRVRQTKRRFNYQPGKGQLVILTVNFNGQEAGTTKRVGYFDSNDGIFMEVTEDEIALVIRSSVSGSPVDTRIVQDDWNSDTLNGRGASGVTLDVSKSLILVLDFEWLGVGNVRAAIFRRGEPLYFHQQTHFQTLESVYMSTPNLPCRYEIAGDGTNGASSLRQICTTVISEGGQELTGRIQGASRGTSLFATLSDTDWYPLISLRLREGYLGTTVDLITSHTLCTTTANYEVAAFFNPTIAGVDAVSWQSTTNSAVEYDISRTNANKLSGGTMLQGTFGADTNQVRITSGVDIVNAVRLGAKIDGTRDQIVIAVRNLSAAVESYTARVEWRELL